MGSWKECERILFAFLSMEKPSGRLLFSSYHCFLDSSSGAALSLRDLATFLTQRGWDCSVLSGPQLDFEEEVSLEILLQEQQFPYQIHPLQWGTSAFAG